MITTAIRSGIALHLLDRMAKPLVYSDIIYLISHTIPGFLHVYKCLLCYGNQVFIITCEQYLCHCRTVQSHLKSMHLSVHILE